MTVERAIQDDKGTVHATEGAWSPLCQRPTTRWIVRHNVPVDCANCRMILEAKARAATQPPEAA